jgi:hypothetical protein
MHEIGVYIAGPLYSSGDLVTNTRAAIDAAQALEQASSLTLVFRPFIPHVLVPTWQLVYPRDHKFAQDYDDYWLRKCDAMLRLPGYSVGAEHEERVAFVHRLPVFKDIAALIDFFIHSK